MATTKKYGLTKAQKRKILRKALELFGPNGEGWTRHKYYGKRISATRSWETTRDEADCWCLVGGLAEAAERLKIHKTVVNKWTVAQKVSILDLVRAESRFTHVEKWNDARGRTFADVKALIEKRLEQLD